MTNESIKMLDIMYNLQFTIVRFWWCTVGPEMYLPLIDNVLTRHACNIQSDERNRITRQQPISTV